MSARSLQLSAPDTVEVVTSLAQLDGMASCWPDLGTLRWGPLTSHEWFSCAARYYCSEATLHCIVVRRAGALVGVAPLCRVRRRGIQWLEIIADRVLFEPLQLPAADEQALVTLGEAIVSQGLPVFIERLEPDDPAIARIESAARGRGTFRVLERAATHYLPQGARWSDSHGTMAEYRRKKRKLEAHGPLDTCILQPTADELAPLLETVFQVESAGWKGRRGSSLLSNGQLLSFFTELCSRLAAKGSLRICLLRCAGQALAAQICVEQGGRLWVLKIGFDEQWRKLSPGMLLTSDTIRYALEDRALGLEFLGVAEDWQREWRPLRRPHCAAVFYPNRPGGMAALALDRLAAWVRGVAGRQADVAPK